VDAGRFGIDDAELALAMAGGALLGSARCCGKTRIATGPRPADTVTENLLRLFGLSTDEAHAICQRPLPDLDAWGQPDSAA